MVFVVVVFVCFLVVRFVFYGGLLVFVSFLWEGYIMKEERRRVQVVHDQPSPCESTICKM